jgi:uncharacterized protein YbaR (Trm112 family)/SAM-dependent methyltransferase
MISSSLLAMLRCPQCHHEELALGSKRLPTLDCPSCKTQYPIVDGIPDLIPPRETPEPGVYRTETLLNLVAGVYHLGAPVLSLAVWRCPPLRWVDSENRALGRANGGVYLRAPLSTGLVLDKVTASYHDVTILGVDRSWNMLRQAKKRLAHLKQPVHLLRADYENLPLRPGVVDSMQSFNGLQTFLNRQATLSEFKRCLKQGGFLSGSALVRGQEYIADATLDRLEQSGIYPMLRAPEFLLHDLEAADFLELRHELHGAIMFFTGTVE